MVVPKTATIIRRKLLLSESVGTIVEMITFPHGTCTEKAAAT
jgi:hypothetical protein